jgi:hypothetical protein
MQLKSKVPEPVDGVTVAPPHLSSALLEGGPRRERWDRLRCAMGHPAHLLALSMLAAGGLLMGSMWALLPIILFELAFIVCAPRLAWVERRADRKRRQKRWAIASRARSSLVAYMEPIHCRELTELERRAQLARAHAASAGEAMELLLDDWYGLDRLLATYVRLSIAHRTARESAMLTDRDQLCLEIRELELTRDRATSARARRLVDRELSVLRMRAACLERNEEEREALQREIASIASLCRLAHDRAVALATSPDLHGDVERMVAEAQISDQAIGEVNDERAEQEEGAPILRMRVPTVEEHALEEDERPRLLRAV